MTEVDPRIGPPLTPEQERLCLENIARCRAYAALPPELKWKGATAEGKVLREKKRTHAGVHRTYTAGRMTTPVGEFERIL